MHANHNPQQPPCLHVQCPHNMKAPHCVAVFLLCIISAALWPFPLKLLSSASRTSRSQKAYRGKAPPCALPLPLALVLDLAMHVHYATQQRNNPRRNSETDSPGDQAGFTCIWTCGPTTNPPSASAVFLLFSFVACFFCALAALNGAQPQRGKSHLASRR